MNACIKNKIITLENQNRILEQTAYAIFKSWFIDFTIPKKYRKYLIYKGSVAVNGVSLTVSKVSKNSFQESPC